MKYLRVRVSASTHVSVMRTDNRDAPRGLRGVARPSGTVVTLLVRLDVVCMALTPTRQVNNTDMPPSHRGNAHHLVFSGDGEDTPVEAIVEGVELVVHTDRVQTLSCRTMKRLYYSQSLVNQLKAFVPSAS